VTDPAAAGLTAGDIYQVRVASGTARFNGAGAHFTQYIGTITRQWTGAAWQTIGTPGTYPLTTDWRTVQVTPAMIPMTVTNTGTGLGASTGSVLSQTYASGTGVGTSHIRSAGYTPNLFCAPSGLAWGSNGIDWSRPIRIAFKYSPTAPNSGTTGWLKFGEARTNTVVGDHTGTHGVGIKFFGLAAKGFCYASSTLNQSGVTLFTQESTVMHYVEIISDGAGNVHFYIDGVLMDSLTGGPTTVANGEYTGIVNCLSKPEGVAIAYQGIIMPLYFQYLT
jgi:hypothetical protein